MRPEPSFIYSFINQQLSLRRVAAGTAQAGQVACVEILKSDRLPTSSDFEINKGQHTENTDVLQAMPNLIYDHYKPYSVKTRGPINRLERQVRFGFVIILIASFWPILSFIRV